MVLMLLSLLLTFQQSPQMPPQARGHVPGRILVKFNANVSDSAARAVLKRNGVNSNRVIPHTEIHVINARAGNEDALIAALSADPSVEFAAVDELFDPAIVTPNDYWFGPRQAYLTQINAVAAWDLTTGSGNVTIAFVDSGLIANHEDLIGKSVPGWNFFDNNSNTADSYGHGTYAAGTAAANTNNTIGIAGICWTCKIMPLRVSGLYNRASSSTIATAITWAADRNVPVVNVGYPITNDPVVKAAALYLNSKGGVVVAPAGNYGVFDPTPDNPAIITVGSMDLDGALASWSNRGNNIDLVAPPCSTVVPGGTNGYTGVCGTSISSAMVAGVAALVRSYRPTLTPADLTRALQLSATDVGATGWDALFGHGQVNAAQAMTQGGAAPPPPPPPPTADTTPPTVSITSPANNSNVSGTVTIAVNATDNVGVVSIAVTADPLSSTPSTAICTGTASQLSCPWSVSSRRQTLRATAKDAAGNTGTATITVNVQ